MASQEAFFSETKTMKKSEPAPIFLKRNKKRVQFAQLYSNVQKPTWKKCVAHKRKTDRCVCRLNQSLF